MPTIPLYDGSPKQAKVGSVDLSDALFAAPVRQHLLHAAVTAQLATRRRGTASTKRRGEVRGGGEKPFRQKGTGRARMGSIRSPLLVGGGVAHGPKPRSFEIRLPKKMRRGALISALSLRASENRLLVIKDFDLPEIKTKHMISLLQAWEVPSALIVVAEATPTVELSARNIPGVSVIEARGLNVYDVLTHPHLIFTESGLTAVQERLETPISRGSA